MEFGGHERFEDLVFSPDCPPLLINNAVKDWPALKWTPEYLASVMGSTKFKCKVSPTNIEEMLWESECLHVDVTLPEYTDWLGGQPKGDNPLAAFDQNMFSCYVDYKYMKDFFKAHSNMLQDVQWDRFGLPGRDGTDSTIWIGSSGAYTNCHYDTYGFNLVAQVYGRKRWFLFPPGQSGCMYPTRIPYEESSVFSEVNVQYPDLNRHPKFMDSTPYVVDMLPGMVLYVPRHWWHFVRCQESAISINTWVPMEQDKMSHLEEAITRLLFSNMAALLPGNRSPSVSSSGLPLLNTAEELESLEVNLGFLQQAVTEVISSRSAVKTWQSTSPSAVQTWQSTSPSAVKTWQSTSPSAVKTWQSTSPSAVQTWQSTSPSAVQKSQSTSPSAVQTWQSTSPSAVQESQSTSPSAVQTWQSTSPSAVQTLKSTSPSAVQTWQSTSPSAVQTSQSTSPSAVQMSQSTSPFAVQTWQSTSPSAVQMSQSTSPSAVQMSQSTSPSAVQMSQSNSPSAVQISQSTSPSAVQTWQSTSPSAVQTSMSTSLSAVQTWQSTSPSAVQTSQSTSPSAVQTMQSTSLSAVQTWQSTSPSAVQTSQSTSPSPVQRSQFTSPCGSTAATNTSDTAAISTDRADSTGHSCVRENTQSSRLAQKTANTACDSLHGKSRSSFCTQNNEDENLKKVAEAFKGLPVLDWTSILGRNTSPYNKGKRKLSGSESNIEGQCQSSKQKKNNFPDDGNTTDSLQSEIIIAGKSFVSATGEVTAETCTASGLASDVLLTVKGEDIADEMNPAGDDDSENCRCGCSEVHVHRLTPVPCSSYIQYLQTCHHYDPYDSATGELPDTGHTPVTVATTDVMNSVLEPSVVQHICQVLLQRVL